MNLITRDPAQLQPLPALRHLPEIAIDSARFYRLCDDLLACGTLSDPLKITQDNRVIDLDSWDRLKAARQAQLAEVQCLVVSPEEICRTLFDILNRRHYTKSALAYTLFPHFKDAHQESRERRAKNLKKGQFSRKSPEETIGDTVSKFAAEIGIARNLYFEASKVHDIFAKDPAYRAQMEPRILAEPQGGEHEDSRPIGLGAVIAGWGGLKATKRQERVDSPRVKLLQKAFLGLIHHSLLLEDVTEARAAIADVLKTVDDSAQLDRLVIIADDIHELAKNRSKALSKEASPLAPRTS
jgi:hypothetical protein